MKGIVVKSTGSWYEVRTEENETISCRLKGIFRLDESKEKDSNPVAVGDKVIIEKEDSGEDWMITTIETRENYIVRASPKHKGARQVIAANIDLSLLVVTMANPRTSSGFIDRYLLAAEAYHIPTHLVFNKQDQLDAKTLKKQNAIAEQYQKIGYTTHFVSALTGENIEAIRTLLKDKTVLIAGHSGVGKSSLMNALEPGLNLRTHAISRIMGKGMHTTTFAEMHFTSFGARVIDTPGIREFGVLSLQAEEVSHYFLEMRPFLVQCKFNNCLHENEPGCAVKTAYQEGKISEDRYGNYLNILYDIQHGLKHWEI